VRCETAFEVFREAEDVGQRLALDGLREQEPGQLTQLNVLELQLPLWIASGNLRPGERGQQSAFLRLRPARKFAMEIGERDTVCLVVTTVERPPEVVEADAKSPIPGEQEIESAGIVGQSPASPGSMRVNPCSLAQRSRESETRSSTSGTGRASSDRSSDLT
jgi:hypothetical protein